MSKATLIALSPDAYSNCQGDYWKEHPADIDFVDGLNVGDEYELTVALNAWEETYRVVKAPSDTDDDYEVERIPNPGHQYVTTEQAEAYANARVKQALESLENFEEIVLTEMERRFSLRGEERQYERLPIDDTQVGVEFAIKQFRALIPKEQT